MVIGGTTTTIIGRRPWMAQLWYYDDRGTAGDEPDDNGFFCGGVVIAPDEDRHGRALRQGLRVDTTNGAVVTGTAAAHRLSEQQRLARRSPAGAYRQWNSTLYKDVQRERPSTTTSPCSR